MIEIFDKLRQEKKLVPEGIWESLKNRLLGAPIKGVKIYRYKLTEKATKVEKKSIAVKPKPKKKVVETVVVDKVTEKVKIKPIVKKEEKEAIILGEKALIVEEDVVSLRLQYLAKYGKEVSNRYMHNIEWIKSKLK